MKRLVKSCLRRLRNWSQYDRRYARSCQRKAPDFAIIGSMKAGTTSLFQYLSSHPDVACCSVKEPAFFSWDHGMGIKNYMSLFPLKKDVEGELVFEASATYLHHAQAAERLNAILPDLKIIVMLRDPIKRAVSHYKYYTNPDSTFALKRPEQIEKRDVLEAFDDDISGREQRWNKRYCSYGLYAKQLEPYYRLFPSENILVLDLEEMKDDPRKLMTKVSGFLGIDDSSFAAFENTAEEVETTASFTADNKKQFNAYNAQSYTVELPEAMNKKLVEFYRDDVLWLKELTGRDYPWSQNYL